MAFDKSRIIRHFDLHPFGVKGWMRSKLLVCPNCHQSDEFAVLFTHDGGIVHCLHTKSCNGYSTSLQSYLKSVGKSSLIDFDESIVFDEFPDFTEEKTEEEAEVLCELPVKKLPIGFRRIDFDEYLDNRGFLPGHYDLFKVGITRLDPRYTKHLIFQFFNDDGECIAWMTRSRKDKEWHDENKRLFKLGEVDLVLRYDNSPDTDFGKILGGYNEITENTKIIILVEGLFDKTNVDYQLNLLKQEEFKCLFAFGNTITDEQINLLKDEKCKNVDTIIILFDEGTIKNSKKYGMKLIETKKEIKICELKKKDADPGELIVDELFEAFEKSVGALSFNFNKIDKI